MRKKFVSCTGHLVNFDYGKGFYINMLKINNLVEKRAKDTNRLFLLKERQWPLIT